MKLFSLITLLVIFVGCESGTTQKKRSFTAKDAAAAEECDNPELYGEDCSGEHAEDHVTKSDAPVVAEKKPAEKVEEPKEEEVKAPPPPPQDPNLVVFKIAAGTGTGPWNQKAATVITKVGQTLRIINEDTVRHRLHTGGSPFAHGANIEPGAMIEYKIESEIDPTAATQAPTYDHGAGRAANFWLKANP